MGNVTTGPRMLVAPDIYNVAVYLEYVKCHLAASCLASKDGPYEPTLPGHSWAQLV